jgi:hypothetical protein
VGSPATQLVVIGALAVAATGCTSASHPASSNSTAPSPTSASALAPIHGHYSPSIKRADFVRTVDNPYWPLPPGTGYHFRGVRGRTPQVDDEVVLHRTKTISGVTCTVVRDTVSAHGHPVERTFDWYAQDRQGNVWYMGEDSLELKNGHFTMATDSWESGINGARPGIIMPAHPQPGGAYRQEFYPAGQALDQARVLRTNASIKVPYGAYHRVLVTSERSPLEPQTEHKFYAPGVGELAERVVKGHHEEFKLVRVTHSGNPARYGS